MKNFAALILLLTATYASAKTIDIEAQQQPISEVWSSVSKKCPLETERYELKSPGEPINVQFEDIPCEEIVDLLIAFDRRNSTN